MEVEFYQEETMNPTQIEVWGTLTTTRSMMVDKDLNKAQRQEVKDIITNRIQDDLRTWLYAEDGVGELVSKKEQWEILFEALERLRYQDEFIRKGTKDAILRQNIIDGLLDNLITTLKKLR